MTRNKNSNNQNEKRELAIKFGQKIIKKNGLAALSIRKIVKELNCSIGTVYNVFKNNDEMVMCINAVTLDDMKKFIEENVCDDSYKKNYEKNIKDLAKFYIIFARKNYNSWSAIFDLKVSDNNSIPDWYQEKIDNLFNLIEKPLSLFLKDDWQIKSSAKIIWASIHGICILNLTNKLNADAHRDIQFLADSLIENYLRGLKNNA